MSENPCPCRAGKRSRKFRAVIERPCPIISDWIRWPCFLVKCCPCSMMVYICTREVKGWERQVMFLGTCCLAPVSFRFVAPVLLWSPNSSASRGFLIWARNRMFAQTSVFYLAPSWGNIFVFCFVYFFKVLNKKSGVVCNCRSFVTKNTQWCLPA